jgi:hypothetical protein
MIHYQGSIDTGGRMITIKIPGMDREKSFTDENFVVLKKKIEGGMYPKGTPDSLFS